MDDTLKEALIESLENTTPQSHPALHAPVGGSIDWNTVIQVILLIISLIQNPPKPTPPAPTP